MILDTETQENYDTYICVNQPTACSVAFAIQLFATYSNEARPSFNCRHCGLATHPISFRFPEMDKVLVSDFNPKPESSSQLDSMSITDRFVRSLGKAINNDHKVTIYYTSEEKIDHMIIEKEIPKPSRVKK